MLLSSAIEDWSLPMIINGIVQDWPAVQKWNPAYLSEKTSLKLSFRIGYINCDSIQWETDAIRIDATIADFIDWQSDVCSLSMENPFYSYSINKFWAYADYKYVCDTLNDFPELIKELCWSNLGFPIDSPQQSTLWLGSPHAYTICHYDTYAYNVVVQLHGTKRWILFPPSDSDNLYPTRIPFEESTVFSRVNLSRPDLNVTPKFAHATPYVVTLKPGQVLFVPRHWWHFVTCEPNEAAISVNLWIDQPHLDNSERLSEALTRLVTFSFIDCNENSDLSSMVMYLSEIEKRDYTLVDDWFQTAMHLVNQFHSLSLDTSQNTSPVHHSKLAKLDTSTSQAVVGAKSVPPSKLTDVFKFADQSTCIKENNVDTNLKPADVLRAFTHPDVIELVKKLLLNEIKSYS